MSDVEIAKAATAVLRKMFGSDNIETENGELTVPDPIGCKHSSWRTDRFATGSWTHFPYSNDATEEPLESDLQEAMREPILYASEATSVDFRGTVHGAYLAGAAQAEEVLKRIRLT